MKRLGFCSALLLALAAMTSAHSAAPPVRAAAVVPARVRAVPAHTPSASTAAPMAPSTFEDYCVECHGADKPKANLNLEKLLARPTADSVGANWKDWERVAEMLESGAMPPKEATLFPSDEERAAGLAWIRTSLTAYEAEHAGDPGRVTVRRLTSAEYAYAVRDLTGIDIKAGIDASSDSVGGEGFANFGDVQFMQDASIERYLEAAKLVADHAVIGAGPLDFYSDPGKTGLELSALSRIDELYASKGFRVVSGEGGFPFGLDRYGKALYVAWFYKHRAALGEPAATLRSLAAKEGITGRFAEHVWSVVNKPAAGYPTRATVDGWRKLPAPTADVPASMIKARAGTDALYKTLTTWPSWFFARGDLAAGGAGDESPLVFDDTSLAAEPSHHFTYALGPRGGRGRGAPTPPAGPVKVSLIVTSLETTPGARPAIVWRNARIVTRAAAAGRGPATPPAAGAGRGMAGPILSTRSLRSTLPAEVAASMKFGIAPDGAALGPDDFAASDTTSFTLDPAADGTVAELQADVELGPDRNAVVRVMISDRPEGSSRDAGQRVLIGDPATPGYRTFRAGIAEYVSLLPPNSHGEANPADKDPVPAPFDNTYNSPEHDAFVMKVKYQRNDDFFTNNIVDGEDRARLNQAWNDLFGSWPYHDAYLGMLADHYGLTLKSRRIKDMGPVQIAALPAAVRPHVTALRAHYDEVVKAQTLAQPGHLANVLDFASRAWRRPLTAADKASLRAFYDRSRTVNRLDHDGAIRALIARVLVSPAFLYRLETVARASDKPLNGSELASRMSFFLWSSIPDDELRRAAAAGELNDPVMLARQVKRMTADPKARRLATEFFGQWLGFYHFDEYRGVDTARFPEFTEDVRTAMYDEAVSTFEFLVREERPVKEILYADYTFLNKPLANFYGIKTELGTSGKMERVEGVRQYDRGGALRLGSVLTVTSAPLRTSPVKRGDWVLRRILGTPTPPPPADAGTLPADDKTFEGLTLRQKLTQHKRNATCATCHLRIDPLGFPLEGFDAVGRSRARYADGNAVDVTGEFADKTTIVGAEGLLTYLQGQDRKVMTTLSRKMLGYALGRTALASDQPLIREMIAAGSASFSDLATRIVTSRQFRNRAGDSAVAPGSTVTDAENRPPQ
jgi:mono/diheme cytochrome c family protein